MLNRHAESVAGERAALATSLRALLALLPRSGEHARHCPGRRGGGCVPACRQARAALTEVRAVLFPWTHREKERIDHGQSR